MQTQAINPELITWFRSMHPVARQQFMMETAGKLQDMHTSQNIVWHPNPDHPDGSPNPQRLALESKADELFYGGAAGGGKSDLLLGAAFSQHKNSALFRRVYPNLRSLILRSVELIGDDKQYNKTNKIWNLPDKIIEFGTVQYEENKKNWQGRAHDLKGFDEITEFTRSQYLFIIGWNRSTDPRQRCRVICTGNPPTDEAGSWVIEEWGPWLDPDHPHKAEPGQLLWYYYDGNNIIWLDNGEPVVMPDGHTIKPRSRTFIPARLIDNPHLHNTGYEAVLNSLPEPMRSQFLHGDFTAAQKTDPWQVIPTAWVREAQRRWMEREKPEMPCSAVGLDVARGGIDSLAISKRYGTWFDEIIKVPGVNVEDGPAAAGMVYNALLGDDYIGYINVDAIGVGTSAYDSLKVMYPNKANPVTASAGSDYVIKKKDKEVLKMKNIRAEYYWRMREALDPEHGDDIALPPGNEIVADLCAARWKPMAGGVVQIEKKDEIKKRIGRSPDVGEAILLANMPVTDRWKSINFLKV